jgi:hypothetical protein
LDVNQSADGQRLILRHDTYVELKVWPGEEELLLEDALVALADQQRSVKIDFKVGGPWIERILATLESVELAHSKLWFNGDLDLLGRAWLSRLSARYPEAIVQIPLNSALDLDCPPVAIEPIVEELVACGVNRWSIGWRYPDRDGLIAELTRRAQEVNIYGVDNLAEFLAALDRRPTSVTADFNFPEWGLYGRGSGHLGHFHTF